MFFVFDDFVVVMVMMGCVFIFLLNCNMNFSVMLFWWSFCLICWLLCYKLFWVCCLGSRFVRLCWRWYLFLIILLWSVLLLLKWCWFCLFCILIVWAYWCIWIWLSWFCRKLCCVWCKLMVSGVCGMVLWLIVYCLVVMVVLYVIVCVWCCGWIGCVCVVIVLFIRIRLCWRLLKRFLVNILLCIIRLLLCSCVLSVWFVVNIVKLIMFLWCVCWLRKVCCFVLNMSKVMISSSKVVFSCVILLLFLIMMCNGLFVCSWRFVFIV